jgi:two-component system sensor histidine kinase TctE
MKNPENFSIRRRVFALGVLLLACALIGRLRAARGGTGV